MKAYILFNKNTPGERVANDLGDRIEAEQVEVEKLDADSSRGIQLVENYDITGRPAVLLVRDDGTPVQLWQEDGRLPMASDVGYLARQ